MKRFRIVAALLTFALAFTGLAPGAALANQVQQTGLQDSDVPSETEQSMFNKGQALYIRRHYDQAANVLRDLLKNYPKSIITDLTLLWLGRCYVQLGVLDDARQVAQRLRTIKDTPFADIFENELRVALNRVSNKPAQPSTSNGIVQQGSEPNSNLKTFTKLSTEGSTSSPTTSGATTNGNQTAGTSNRGSDGPPLQSSATPGNRASNQTESNQSVTLNHPQDMATLATNQGTAPREDSTVQPGSGRQSVSRNTGNRQSQGQNRSAKSQTSTVGPQTSNSSYVAATPSLTAGDTNGTGEAKAGALNITVRQPSSLTLAVKRVAETAWPGQTVLLPVTVTNTGNAAERFRLETDLGAEYQPSFSLVQSATASDLPILVTPPIPRGGFVEATLSLRIPQTAQNGSLVPYNVRAFSESDAQVTRLESGTIHVVATMLNASAVASKSAVLPGETFSQNITIQNTGGVMISSSRADFVFNPNFELVASSLEAAYDRSARTAVWNLGDLNAGEQRQITVTLRAVNDANAQTTRVGRGRIRSQSSPVQVSFDGPGIEVSALPRVRVDAVSVGLTARPGETVYFPFIVRNVGNITDTYDLSVVASGAPAATLYVDTNGDGQHQSNEPIINQTPQLDPQSPGVPMLLRVEVPSTTIDRQQYSYNVVARSSSTDRVSGDASSVLTVTMPRVTVRIEQITESPAPGAVIYYRLVIINEGNGLAKKVAVVENLPDALQLVSTDPNLGRPDSPGSSQQFVWRLAELAPGETAVLRVGARLTPNLRPDTNLTTRHTVSFEDTRGNAYRP
jgi:uncharacterized membrane protein